MFNSWSKRKGKLNNKGLSFIEVLVSITIFSIMVVPIVLQLSTLLKSNKKARLNQAETDYASRVMEQFKQTDSASLKPKTDANGNIMSGVSCDAGYMVNKDNNTGVVTYEMDGINPTKDMYTEGTQRIENGVTYSVIVSKDAKSYSTASSTNSNYHDLNAGKEYDLKNIDTRYAVLIQDVAGNYDQKANDDLFDMIGAKLKNDPSGEARYNQWLAGAPNLSRVKYKKNTYVKITKGTNNGKNCYFATVVLNYSSSKYQLNVSYVIMKDKVYYASKVGNRPPYVYYFYNQFVQNRGIENNTDTLTIDNSGLNLSNPTKEDKMKVYVVKSQADVSSKYTYFEKDAASGDAYGDSYAYEVQDNGETKYFYTLYKTGTPLPASDYTPINSGVTTSNPVYYYKNVLLASTYRPGSDYTKKQGIGYYSYKCNKDNTSCEGGKILDEGDVVYQTYDNYHYKYVWPDGTSTSTAPSMGNNMEKFTLCTPSKIEDNSNAKLNVLLANSSKDVYTSGISETKLISLYSNLDEDKIQSSSNGVSKTIIAAPMTSGDSVAKESVSSYNTIDITKTFNKISDDETDDKTPRIYRLYVSLYKIVNGTKTHILTLQSGKEN